MSSPAGKYELIKCLARGGMAEIWLAQQRGVEGFGRLVCVKKILPGLSEHKEFIHMFLDEARLAAQLNHPGIVEIYELGTSEDGDYFIAMEFIHGENLRLISRRALENNGIPLTHAAKIISLSAAALYHAHTRSDLKGRPLGIVHRDVSPQNILVSYEGIVKLVDFGIAKAASSLNETQTGIIKGKHPYMSPEQVLARKLDGRSDLYSLGIVLWELITNQRLYGQQTDFLIMDAIVKQEPPAPSSVRKETPPELDDIVLRCLAKRPNDRFVDAHQLHIALEKWLQSTHELVSSVELAGFLRELCGDRYETWRKIFESRGEIEEQLLEELSGFLVGPSSSKIAATPLQETADTASLMGEPPAPTRAERPRTPPASEPAEAPVERFDHIGGIDPAPRKAPSRPEGMLAEAPVLDEPEPPARAVQKSPQKRRRTFELPPLEEQDDEEEPLTPHPTPEPERRTPPPRAVERVSKAKARRDLVDRLMGGPVGLVLKLVVGVLTVGGAIFIVRSGLDSMGVSGDVDALVSPVSTELAMGTGIVTRGVLRVRSKPAGATVVIDGDELGLTPLTMKYAPSGNQVLVELRKKGFRPWKKRIRDAKSGIRIEAKLSPW